MDVMMQTIPTPKMAMILSFRTRLSRRFQRIRKGNIMTVPTVNFASIRGTMALTHQIGDDIYCEGIEETDLGSSSIPLRPALACYGLAERFATLSRDWAHRK